jgi:hypothetical protein
MSAGNVYAATLVQTCNDTRFANVLHFKQSAGGESPDPKADLAELIETGLVPAMATGLSVQWVPKCVHIRKLGLAGQDYFRLNFAATTGDVAGEALPTDLCCNVQCLTALLGRGSSGRVFLSGIPETAEEDNCVNDAELALLANTSNWLSQDQVGTAYTWRAGLLKPGNTLEPFVEGQPHSAVTILKSRKPDFAC